ncbi:hypothetical protein PhCBS80983_g04639 [Powellomyces hirtus]|uniref:Ubiquitin-like domain-containing protein n=1 Tax=Powellomyces hirtus TaxID=109895 RepID=A0A507DZ81_9FUNG|nr:hypothetical protein PhCBS80983_g04639 [Powellomyces hirtus]
MVDPTDSTTHTVTEPATERPTTTAHPVVVNDKIPGNKINLRFLLISSKRTDMLFDPQDTIEIVKNRIWQAWPSEWEDEHPESPQHLRVVHQGKFMEANNTLASHKLDVGATTTVHLLLRSGPAAEADEKSKPNAEQATRGCRCCIVM